ncbi:MAG: hypothetical protein Q9169_008240 [Polycauliona sp. 2 TL-2023]
MHSPLLLLAASSLTAAKPLVLSHRHAAEAKPALVERQEDPSSHCTTLVGAAIGACILNEALATFPSSLQPQQTPAPGPTTTDDSPTTTAPPGEEESGTGGGPFYVKVSVAKPSLCSESALQFSSSWPAPTGSLRISGSDVSGEAAWGEEGSVWNISASDGVKLENFRVPCQGSICTGITGNTEEDGKIEENDDGSWTFTVTPNMQPSVALFGDASGGNLGDDGKFDFQVTSTPPCGKPVFQNCSDREFLASTEQWEAYSAGDFLRKYVEDNEIKSLSALELKASEDFLPGLDDQARRCTPDVAEYVCTIPPSGTCEADKPDAVAGFLVVAAVSRMSNMLRQIYDTIDKATLDMTSYITQVVVKFFQPQAEQEWQAIVTAVSALVGLFIFAAVLIDGLTAGTATVFIVAAVIAVQSTLSATSAFKNGFEAQKPDSTYLAINGDYSQSVTDYAKGLRELIAQSWTNEELTGSGVLDALANGAWLQIKDPLDVSGLTEDMRDWLNNLLVTSYINRVFMDADAYIVFVPYKAYPVRYPIDGPGEKNYDYDLTKDECAKRWAGNPSWAYYATCDITLGSSGEEGMAVITRPSSQGKGSKSWTSDVEWSWSQEAYVWDSHKMMDSALTGYGDNGFGYNLTNVDFANILNSSPDQALEEFTKRPLDIPGLFSIPVCTLTNFMELPGGGVPAGDHPDWTEGAGVPNNVFKDDPASCAESTYNGGAKFCDNVSDAIKKAVGCP